MHNGTTEDILAAERLRAAAPDLLEALSIARLVVIAYDTASEIRGFGLGRVEVDGRAVSDLIDAAIAKATGQQP